MKILTKAADWLQRNGYFRMASLMSTWAPTKSGVTVDEYKALTCSVIWACVNNISSVIGSLPIHVFEGDGSESKLATKSPLWPILHGRVNSSMSSGAFVDTLTRHVLIWGDAFAQKVYASGTDTLIGLYPITPNNMIVEVDERGEIVYTRVDRLGARHPMPAREVFHLRGPSFDGVRGYRIAQLAAESIGVYLSAEAYSAMFFAGGGRLPGVLEYAGRFKTKEEFDAYREAFESTYSGQGGVHKTMILESGVKFTALGVKPQEMQLVEVRAFLVSELCRWFNLSPVMVGDLSRANFSNVEQLSLDAVKFSYGSWIKRWEDAFALHLVDNPREFTKMNLDALLRGDFESRMRGYATCLQNGVRSINEVRALENLNPIEGGDSHHIQLNMQSLPGGEPTTGQLAALYKIGGPKGTA
jgi:HK97 family phage portal protein